MSDRDMLLQSILDVAKKQDQEIHELRNEVKKVQIIAAERKTVTYLLAMVSGAIGGFGKTLIGGG